MRIAFVSEHASPLATPGGTDTGGQNVHVAELAAALVRQGHSVTVYTRRDHAELPATVRTPDGVQVVHLDAGPPRHVPRDDLWPFMPAFADQLGHALDRQHPDLVHAHFWMSGWATMQAARPRGVPTVLTFHALGAVKRRNLGAEDPSPAVRIAVERELACTVDRVIATCRDEVDELRAAHAVPRHVSVVPCGVDIDLFTPDGPAADRGAWPHRIITVGRIVPRKGFATVVEALPRLRDTELVIVGGAADGEPERDQLRRLADRLGVLDRVQLLPQVPHDDVPALLRSADVLAAVPWYEPFGIVPVEAMACGVPVVGSAVGGLLDTIEPGVTGLLVQRQDPAALAHAIDMLLRRPDLRARFAAAAAARARRLYSWPSVATATLAAYRRTLATSSSGHLVAAAEQ